MHPYRPLSTSSTSSTPLGGEEDKERSNLDPSQVNRRLRARKCEAIAVIIFLFLFALVVVASIARKWSERRKENDFYGILNRTTVEVVPTPPTYKEGDDMYLAMCVSIKDQAYDLPEFLRHHYYHLNIRTFYLFDDGTVPPLQDQLNDVELGIPRSSVHFLHYDHRTRNPPQQINAYTECVRMYKNRHRWFALIDVDELFEMTEPGLSIHNFLRGFEKTAGAVAVNWLVHGWNNLEHRPARGASRRAFTQCLIDQHERPDGPVDNSHVKVIVQGEAFDNMFNPHYARLKGPLGHTVGENGTALTPPMWLRTPATREKITLHHYVTKSRDEYAEKVSRGNGMDDGKKWDFWEYMKIQPNRGCTSLAGYYP